MKVLVVSHLYPSDTSPMTGIFVEQQAVALSRLMEIEVLSVSQTGRGGVERRQSIHITRVRLGGMRWLPSRLSTLLRAIPYAWSLVRHIRRSPHPPNLMHAHYGFPDGVVAIFVGRLLRIPVVVTLHGSDVNRQIAKGTGGSHVARALTRADCLIFVSSALKVKFETVVPAGQFRSIVLHNGYDSTCITHVSKNTPSNLLFLGTLNPVKNPDILLRAFASSDLAVLGISLLVAGDGPLRIPLESLVEELGIAKHVKFLGRVEHRQVPALLRDAIALVLPSSSEGLPIVVLESLASGTPVVASKVGGIPEIIADERFGILVEPGCSAQLSNALRAAVERDWDSQWIAENAPIMDWADNAKRLVELYREVYSIYPGNQPRRVDG